MITDKDIEKLTNSLKNSFVTKDEFSTHMQMIHDKFESMENRINAKLTDMQLSFLQIMNNHTDMILQELQSQRTDWKNHERRITRLEEKAGFIV